LKARPWSCTGHGTAPMLRHARLDTPNPPVEENAETWNRIETYSQEEIPSLDPSCSWHKALVVRCCGHWAPGPRRTPATCQSLRRQTWASQARLGDHQQPPSMYRSIISRGWFSSTVNPLNSPRFIFLQIRCVFAQILDATPTVPHPCQCGSYVTNRIQHDPTWTLPPSGADQLLLEDTLKRWHFIWRPLLVQLVLKQAVKTWWFDVGASTNAGCFHVTNAIKLNGWFLWIVLLLDYLVVELVNCWIWKDRRPERSWGKSACRMPGFSWDSIRSPLACWGFPWAPNHPVIRPWMT
jgi:hypothetical protein